MEKLINTMVAEPFWTAMFAIGFAIAFIFGFLCAFAITEDQLEQEENQKRSACQDN